MWDEETSPPQYQWTPEMPFSHFPQGPASETPSTVPSPRERKRRQAKYARPLPIPQSSSHDAPSPFFRHQSQKDLDEENTRREAWAAELLERCQSEYIAPLLAEAKQATAEVEASVLGVEGTQVKDRRVTILALRSLGTRIQEVGSQPLPAQADVGGPLTH